MRSEAEAGGDGKGRRRPMSGYLNSLSRVERGDGAAASGSGTSAPVKSPWPHSSSVPAVSALFRSKSSSN